MTSLSANWSYCKLLNNVISFLFDCILLPYQVKLYNWVVCNYFIFTWTILTYNSNIFIRFLTNKVECLYNIYQLV